MSKDRKWLKVMIWIAGIVVALILIGVITLRVVLTKEKIISMVMPLVESNINRKVEVKDASLSIWGGIGLDIKGITIYSLPEFSHKELAQIEAVSLKVKLFPLLKRRVELTKGILTRPRIVIEKNEKQVYNWDNLVKGGPAFVLPLVFGQMEIKDGTLFYAAPSEMKEISISGINQKIRFSLGKEAKVKAQGELTVGDISISFPKFKGKFPAVPVSLKHDLEIDLKEDKLKINRFDLTMAEAGIAIKGDIEKIRTVPFLNVEISSKELQLEKIVAHLSAIKKELAKFQILGQADFNLNLKGQARRIPPPELNGKLSLRKVKISYANTPFLLEIPYVQALFNPKNISFSTSDASLAGMPLSFRGVVENFTSPNFDFELKGDFDLQLLRRLEQFPKDAKLAGKAEFDLRAYGKLENPKGAKLSGWANLRGINVEDRSLTVPVKNLDAKLVLRDYDLSIEELKCNLGQSDLELKGKISEIVPYFLFAQKSTGGLRVDFALSSHFLNIDELLPAGDTTRVTKEQQTPKKAPIAFADIPTQGKISADRIIFRKISFSDFSADLSFFDRILRLENISSKVYQGTVDGTVKYDLTGPENPKFDLVFNAKGVEADDLSSNLLGSQLSQGLGGRIHGKLNLTSHFKGQGTGVDDIKSSLWGEGKGDLTDGRIQYGEFISALGKSLSLDIPKEDHIKALTNSFRVANERVYFDDYQLVSTKADWNITGSIGFDKTLDYLVVLSLPMEVAKQLVKSGDLLALLEDRKGKVVIPLRVGGTLDSPRYSLDTSQAKKKLTEDIKEKTKIQGEELLKKIFGK